MRLAEHKEKRYSDSYTASANDWVLFFSIDNLNYSQARKIESHVKRMKSKTYIENLKKYPEMVQKLLDRFQV
jgi:putative endonuclease